MNPTSWNPTQYEKFKNERSQPFLDLMNMLKPVPHGRAIDLGCGTGELTQVLHRFLQAEMTMGLDSSAEMLKDSQKFSGEGLSFIQGSIEQWHSREKFDVVLSNAAIQWCQHHEKILAHIYDSLKTDGQLGIQMPMNYDYPTHILSRDMSHEPHWKNLLRGETYDQASSMLSLESYSQTLYKLGFREQKVLMRIYAHQLDSREGVIEWVRGPMLTHFKNRLSSTDYEQFLREYRQRLFAILPDERPFFYPFKRIFLWARR
ncbi:MAG TPA: methyltransferase domain-containing protein [Bdellovibrio sp.]|nr:methyltransferase domain-containing protein [Bdellovibrio sp.]